MDDLHSSNEALVDMFIFETSQLIDQLEISMLAIEKTNTISMESINEIFRAMHTIKGSSSVMMLANIASVSHAMEDLFYFIREERIQQIDLPTLSSLILEGVDFIKVELHKFQHGIPADGEAEQLLQHISEYLQVLQAPPGQQQKVQGDLSKGYQATVHFVEDCDMLNVRALTVVHFLAEHATDIKHEPADLMEDVRSVEQITERGLSLQFESERSYEELHAFFARTSFMKSFELAEQSPPADAIRESEQASAEQAAAVEQETGKDISRSATSIISVSVSKMDSLMDLVGELVIAEAMVTQNPELKGMELDDFHKAARQLRKITGELQDLVMSIRMVALAPTFHKMHRVVRDMTRKLDKEVHLSIIGEETGVDKNIIEQISDPLMHLVRNAVDHGIESAAERLSAGKPEAGTVTLEARNEGGDVLVFIKDDGKGLDTAKLLARAQANGLLRKNPEEMTDKEVFQLIFLPGFSTKEQVTEFSGRGVGMDVVAKNIESIGGTVSVDSTPGAGTTMMIKIPLTLAIIDGMNIKVGASSYTVPTAMIKQSFRAFDSDIIADPGGNEMIMVRGHIYPILRLNELYAVQSPVRRLEDGILMMLEYGEQSFCLFADELIGQQQVVVKALPAALQHLKKVEGIAGCTLLGDGSISLILDVGELYRAHMAPVM